jgi:CHAT domain-containing protein
LHFGSSVGQAYRLSSVLKRQRPRRAKRADTVFSPTTQAAHAETADKRGRIPRALLFPALFRVPCVIYFVLASTPAYPAVLAPQRPCTDLLGLGKPYLERSLSTVGTTPVEIPIALPPGHDWLIEVREHGNDALVEIQDSVGHVLAQADHPERRTGTRRIILSSSDSRALNVRVTGKEHEAVTGGIHLLVFDLAALSNDSVCERVYRSLAAADSDYAIGQQISLGRLRAPPDATSTQSIPSVNVAAPAAREAYLHAAEGYRSAQALLDNPADAELRGEVSLAVAGIEYFDLKEWRASAESAGTAEQLFATRDAYRRARARALTAAAWIEMATDSAHRDSVVGAQRAANELLRKSRSLLRELVQFHMRRHEPYDAALQLNNIGVAYSYEGRFRECIAAARSASELFARLKEAPRRALAWQNQALCFWGLGHLPEALDAFNRSLKDLKPDPYPHLYLIALINTALINYALGHFDESLALQDRALELAVRTQDKLREGESLYGIGVTYYALGDRAQAREFLERSLAIRTAALDARGRRASLRSLATIYADLGEYAKALQLDQEALTLATAATPRARTRVQLAIHTALAGDSPQALELLHELIDSHSINDPLIAAQARLERAIIERREGRYGPALDDLSIAIPVFRRFGSVTDGFNADLERARALRLTGQTVAALAAIGQALSRSEAIRTQSANPELRAQLQLPLRPAYDLKLELLWEKFDSASKAGQTQEAASIALSSFRTADAARARSFADVAAQQYSAATRRAFSPDLARREALYRGIAGMRFALDARLDRHGSGDARARQYATELAGLQRQVDTLNNALAARMAKEDREVPSLTSGNVASRVSDQKLSPPVDAAVIAYWMGDRSAYAWVLTSAGIHWKRLSDPASITEAARAFHDALDRLADLPKERRIETSSTLYAEVYKPIEAWVAPYRRLLFVPDAALDYIPFAALRAAVSADYIVAQHDVAVAPAAWRLFAPRTDNASDSHRMLLVSDPVYELSDPRMSRSTTPTRGASVLSESSPTTPTYRRLPGTAREAIAIQREFRTGEVDALSGFQASRERLLHLDWAQYRYIHIASHGEIDASMPQLSSLILSVYDEHGRPIDGTLRAADLSQLNLTADVAVFSGCDTALGKVVLNEGIVGITYAVLARGTQAVISSLWRVPDDSSEHLMTEFYGHLIRDSMSPASAWSASMRSVLDRNPLADPALWAAFQVSVSSIGGPARPPERPP